MSSSLATRSAIVSTTGLLAWALLRWVRSLSPMTGSSTAIARACASAIGEMRKRPADTPRSLECPECERTYTVVPGHAICVSCRAEFGEALPTEGSDRLPIYDAQRSATLAHLQEAFQAFYERRKEHRNRLGYAEPEAIGARRAREEARVLRELEEAVRDED